MAEQAERLESLCRFKESKEVHTKVTTMIKGRDKVRVKLDIKEEIIECDLNSDPSTLSLPQSNGELNFELDIGKTVFQRKDVTGQVNVMFVNGHWARNVLLPLSNVLTQLRIIYPEW